MPGSREVFLEVWQQLLRIGLHLPDVLEYRLCLAALPADLELDQRGEEFHDHLPVPGGPLHQPYQVGQEGPTGPLSSAATREGPSSSLFKSDRRDKLTRSLTIARSFTIF